MSESITKATPSRSSKQVYFNRADYNEVIWAHAYSTIFEKALACPCCQYDSHPLANCQNCLGTGWFYVNPYETNALISGINSETQYQKWTEEKLGTISVTVRNEDKINFSFFDRLTIRGEWSQFSERLGIRTDDETGNSFVFLTYKPIEILGVFAFVSSSSPLVKLDKSDYNISETNPYALNVAVPNIANFNNSLSVFYKHELQYHIIDLPHEIRSSLTLDRDGKLNVIKMPYNAIARRSHLIQNAIPDYNGSGLNNNSWR